MLLIPRISGVHTEMQIEAYEYDKSQLDAIKSLSLRAWSPVFDLAIASHRTPRPTDAEMPYFCSAIFSRLIIALQDF